MKKILFATENESKVARFKKALLNKSIEIISINNLEKKIEVNEDGQDDIENALIKARAYARYYKDIPVLAMDDSLFIENVPQDKQPGLFVRRVNGQRLSDEEMLDYYSNLAKTYGENGLLTARWIYGIALINNQKEFTYTWSKDDFYLTAKRNSKINPGYPLNSISINKKLNKYFTDITPEEKQLIQEDETDVIEFICDSLK